MTATTHHRDGTITYWAVYRQTWIARAATIPDRELAAMSPTDRQHAIHHLSTQDDQEHTT